MSRHLTDAEIVDCMDARQLPRPRQAHLEDCDMCRSRVDLLQATLDQVQQEPGGVPDPSPLFWEHFSRRVSEAIDQDPPATRWRKLSVWAPMATALILCAGALIVWNQARSLRTPAPSAVVVEAPGIPTPFDQPVNLEDDVEWSLVRVAADELEWESAADAGIRANPGSAERVALEMSAAERQELERLIEAEMKQTGA